MSSAMRTPEKVRTSISMTGSTLDLLLTMSEGNPGAASVLTMLMKDDPFGFIAMLSLDDMNIRGCQIWVGYKDHCGQDIEAFKKAIEDRDAAMIETINRIAFPQIGERAVAHGASFNR